jgi:hypothetical protein
MVSPEEQAVLENVVVRPRVKSERDPFDRRLIQDHYLHRAAVVAAHHRRKALSLVACSKASWLPT